MKTSSIPQNESAADRAMDALLREHARLQNNDDEDFLAKFDELLANESDTIATTLPTIVKPGRRSSIFKITAFAAAACVCLGMALYMDRQSEPATTVAIATTSEQKPSETWKPERDQFVPLAQLTETDDNETTGSVKVSGITLVPAKTADSQRLLDPNRGYFVSEGAQTTNGDRLASAPVAPSSPTPVLNPNLGNVIATGKTMSAPVEAGPSATPMPDLQKPSTMAGSGGGNMPFTGASTYNADTPIAGRNQPLLAAAGGSESGVTLSTTTWTTSIGSSVPVNSPAPVAAAPSARSTPEAQKPSILTKSGAGTMTLSGTTTYSGGILINGGVSQPAQPSASPSMPLSPNSTARGNVTLSLGKSDSVETSTAAAPRASGSTGAPISSNTITLAKAPSSDLNAPGATASDGRERDRLNNFNTTIAPTDSGNRYKSIPLNPFRAVTTEPLSTFSVDVDTASYANLRRIIQGGGSVPPEAVRIEEMINYFPYRYEEPQGEHPFSVKVESAPCPWENSHRLVKIALKAKEMDRSKRSSANLVFLVDVSGSMQGADRLGLVVENLRVLTKALLPDDTVAIVTYAGSEGLALPPTSGADKATILAKLDSLGAGGSTNGGAGIKLAYSTAQSRFLKEGINRVILCTDGDFNVGTTNEGSLVDLVASEAKKGIFLTVCGYGSGNLNDSMLEAITNKGNGVYHYIDSAREGRKVFQDELLGTLFTVAKDVKLQIEFNPQHAAQYRLIGYENRTLAKEDFANDKVDAGDIGAGHRVTALYEVIPVGATDATPIPLKYQQPAAPASEPIKSDKPANPELLTVKLRYKEPTSDVSKPFDVPFVDDPKASPSADLTFAATVAEFGERLRGHAAPNRTTDQLIEAAESARGDDPHGHRGEFIELMRKASQ